MQSKRDYMYSENTTRLFLIKQKNLTYIKIRSEAKMNCMNNTFFFVLNQHLFLFLYENLKDVDHLSFRRVNNPHISFNIFFRFLKFSIKYFLKYCYATDIVFENIIIKSNRNLFRSQFKDLSTILADKKKDLYVSCIEALEHMIFRISTF